MTRATYNAELKTAVAAVLAGRGTTALATIERELPATIARPGRTTLAKIVTGLGWVKAQGPGSGALYRPAPCSCAECRGLDQAHPSEGEQLVLIGGGA